MKNIIIPIISLIAITAFMSSCEDVYDKHEKFMGERVYPAKYDTIVGHIGFERVRIDLVKEDLLRNDSVPYKGKAQKTVVEYGEGQKMVIDSLVTHVIVDGLTGLTTRLYEFEVYTVDQNGNESVRQKISLIPFTSGDLEQLEVAPPQIKSSPSTAVVTWPGGISSVLMEFDSLEYQYTDKDGNMVTGGAPKENQRFFIGNVEQNSEVQVKMTYHIIPLVNQQPIMDTVAMVDTLTVDMPTPNTEFRPVEQDILEANGVETFTGNGVAGIDKLVYPVHAGSIADIFYFSDLDTLDLTGGDMFTQVPTTIYNEGWTGVVDSVGGEYLPIMKNVIDVQGQAYLKDFLESGILKKVIYRPGTMGLDELLKPYVESGLVELKKNPESVMLDDGYELDGLVQDWNWETEVTYPATDAPAGNNLQNTFKVVLKNTSATFVIAFPEEYKLNAGEYNYLKMKVYVPKASYFEGKYEPFTILWPRFMHHLWSFGSKGTMGWHYWDTSIEMAPNADAYESWRDITIDISDVEGYHLRVFALNIGHEPWIDFQQDIPYYISNIRFTKTK